MSIGYLWQVNADWMIGTKYRKPDGTHAVGWEASKPQNFGSERDAVAAARRMVDDIATRYQHVAEVETTVHKLLMDNPEKGKTREISREHLWTFGRGVSLDQRKLGEEAEANRLEWLRAVKEALGDGARAE